MDYEHIKFMTLKVFTDCDLHSFPINCFEILNRYELVTLAYSQLNEELRKYCKSYSEDAFNYKNKICYNDSMPIGRIRFSLMHELGHSLLKHGESSSPRDEQEANYFASHILAPRMAIHYANCKNYHDVSKLFGITGEAAQYAFNDYRRWHRDIVYHKMNSFDKSLYSHFYQEDIQRFVYSIKNCVYCGEVIINLTEDLCSNCNTSDKPNPTNYDLDNDLLIAESQWLYGGL
jgi:Zn-dependent peptidase ImmA (M78 family)